MRKACFLILAFVLVSCSTMAKFRQKDYMYAMVYDLDGNAIDSVSFFLDGKAIGTSDIYGRFLMVIPTAPDEKTHTMKVTKQGHLEITDEIRLRPEGILYYRMGSAQQYFELAEKALDEKNYQEALDNIEKAERVESGDDIMYLKALILSRMGRKDEARQEIEKASRKVDELIGEIER